MQGCVGRNATADDCVVVVYGEGGLVSRARSWLGEG